MLLSDGLCVCSLRTCEVRYTDYPVSVHLAYTEINTAVSSFSETPPIAVGNSRLAFGARILWFCIEVLISRGMFENIVKEVRLEPWPSCVRTGDVSFVMF